MTFQSIKYKALTLLAAVTLVFTGCHSDSPCPPGTEEPETPVPEPDKVTLCLNVSFDGQDNLTRANDPNYYDDPTGTFEKISTIRVIIVRNLIESATETTGIVEANRLVRTNDAGHPISDNFEFKVIANEEKRIYLVANEEFITAPVGFESATKFLDTFKVAGKNDDQKSADLLPLSEWTVSVPGLTSSMTEIKGYGNGLFSPSLSPDTKRRLPLTEFFDIEVKRTDEVDDLFYSHLFMTRAAAKAVFYLNTSDNFAGDGIKNTSIKAISLKGVGTTEYVFPNTTEYSPSKESLVEYSTNDHPASLPRKEAYITTFATPATNREVTYLINDVNAEIKKPADGKARAITEPIYFPESILEPGKYYEVGVQLSNGTWLTALLDNNTAKHNILSIKNDDGEHQAIARNTYLPIELYFDGAANLTVNVLPWDREDYYVDYTANVGITNEGCLAFTGTAGQTGDYLLLDKKAAQLVLNYGKVAKGSFTIASPVGNAWDAYLITTGGTMDAIQFQIPDPDDNTKTITTTHISGKIGEKAEFGIVSTVAPGSEQNSAQLIVMATLATGTQVIVDVLKNWGEENPGEENPGEENPGVRNPGILTVIQNPI